MKNLEARPESSEESKSKFVYRDNSKRHWNQIDKLHGEWVSPIIFECIAENILDADKMYEEKIGNKPEKQRNVGCSAEKIVEEDK